MKTFADCRVQTRTYLDEAVQADWLDNQVDLAINAAYQKTRGMVVGTYEDYYLTKTQLNTVAEKVEYTVADGIPSNLFKFRRVEVNYSPTVLNANASRVLPVQMDEIRTNLNNSLGTLTTNRNPAYYKYGFGSNLIVGLLPPTTESAANAFTIWHIPVLSDLVLANDQVNIPNVDEFWWSIPLIAAASLLRKGQQEEVAAQNYINDGNANLNRMIQQLEDYAAEESKSIIDVQGESTDFGSPF